MAIMTQLWGFLTSPEGYQAVVITIRERPRLSPQAASWLPKVLTTAQDQLTRSLQRLPWLPLAKATCAQLATAIITTFQATMYSQLLLADQRQWTPTVRERLSAQLHFLLTRLLKAEAEA